MPGVLSGRKTVGITMDLSRTSHRAEELLRVPAPGDILASECKNGAIGSVYEIVTVREVRRRDPAAEPRFALRCRRSQAFLPSDIIWFLRWYPRRRRSG
jgi:hypothetical protein